MKKILVAAAMLAVMAGSASAQGGGGGGGGRAAMTPEQMAKMEALMRRSMEEGAVGLVTASYLHNFVYGPRLQANGTTSGVQTFQWYTPHTPPASNRRRCSSWPA